MTIATLSLPHVVNSFQPTILEPLRIPTLTVSVAGRSLRISWITPQCIAVEDLRTGRIRQVRGDVALAVYIDQWLAGKAIA